MSYNEHKNYLETLSPYDRQVQLAFEKKIELLIIYKQMHKLWKSITIQNDEHILKYITYIKYIISLHIFIHNL